MKKIFVSLLVILFSSISYSQSTFVNLVLEEIDNGGAVPGTTYRLYAELNGGLVYAVYANEANPLLIESTADFYQDGFGGDLQSDLNSAFFSIILSPLDILTLISSLLSVFCSTPKKNTRIKNSCLIFHI